MIMYETGIKAASVAFIFCLAACLRQAASIKEKLARGISRVFFDKKRIFAPNY